VKTSRRKTQRRKAFVSASQRHRKLDRTTKGGSREEFIRDMRSQPIAKEGKGRAYKKQNSTRETIRFLVDDCWRIDRRGETKTVEKVSHMAAKGVLEFRRSGNQ